MVTVLELERQSWAECLVREKRKAEIMRDRPRGGRPEATVGGDLKQQQALNCWWLCGNGAIAMVVLR